MVCRCVPEFFRITSLRCARLRFVCRKIISTAVRIANGSKERLTLGNVSIQRDWGLAAEYTEATWRILQQEQVDDFVIATGETCTLRDLMAARICRGWP